MTCPSCAHSTPPGAKFCEECGASLTRACASCGSELNATAKFCGECGAKAEALAALRDTGPTRIRAPRDYTPQHLADKILQSKSALEGERKQVTVLFADIKGSMEMAEQVGAEAWHGILDRFFEILAEGVHRFEGTINQYTGDGIMALFGAPIAHEDHAERACYASLALQETVRAYAKEVRSEHGIPFGVRIGLNSGEVVVGRIGDDLRMDYTAQGSVVGLAQRMESLADSGHIYLTEHTAQRVEGYFEVQDLGLAKVKGVQEPVRLFDLEGLGEFRTRLDRSRARGLSAFVGRENDMATLEAALEAARSGDAQVVGLMAEAGTGKSRLCAEFLDGCRAQGIPIYEGRGVAHGKSIPMLPILQHWRSFYEIEEGDSDETARSKIAGRLLLMNEGFREVLPIVFDLFGVSDPASPAAPIDADQRQKHLHGVVRQILHDPGYGGTRIHLLEDLHWFDGASDGFLQTMIESLPATRDLMLVNFRPEYQAPWMQRSYYRQIPLQPLGPEAIRALLREQLGENESVQALPEMIHERTKGNPFFIEEVVQMLVERGHLEGSRGDYQLTTAIEALEVPSSVHSVLAARIDRLDDREKRLLQTAAAIGKTFPETLLRDVVGRISELDETELSQALSSLVAAEFLFEAALYPHLEYSFKHPLTQEVAQGSQLREQRARVHAAVAESLEEAGGNQDEQAAEIAQHWEEAEETERAAQWFRRAAEWAGLSDPREGLRHWAHVRELAPSVANPHERDELSLLACVQLFTLGWRMGSSAEDAAIVFAEGRELAERAGDRVALACLVGFYGLMRAQNSGSALDYVRYGEEAAAIAAECDNPALRAGIGTLPAFGHFYVGDGHEMILWADRVLAETGDDGMLGREIAGYSPRASMLFCRARGLIDLGRLAEAESAAHEAIRAAELAPDLEVLGWAQWNFAALAYMRGNSGSALEQAQASVEGAERLDNESSRVISQWAIALAHLAGGDHRSARGPLESASAKIREQGVQRGWLPIVTALLSETQVALGEPARALENAREAIALAQAGGNQYHEVQAQLALVNALLQTDGADSHVESEAALERAGHLADALDAKSLAPRIIETRGRLAAVLGDLPASTLKLRQAFEGFVAIGASGHAERLRVELEA